MMQHRVGEAQIALGVLEVDRIDLVRHGRGSHFAGDCSLFEITERNIAPNVSIEIDQDGVETSEGVKQLGDIIMWFDLRGIGVPTEPETGNKALSVALPVNIWVRAEMRVVVAHRTIDFAEDFHFFDLRELA